jgi:hypothetical protein
MEQDSCPDDFCPTEFLTLVTKFYYFNVNMKAKAPTFAFLALLFLPVVALAQEGTSVTQTLTVEVMPITKIAVSGNPGALLITASDDESGVLSVSDENSKYSMVTNLENMKIVASINNPMPVGTKLMVRLETTKGLSNGFVDVSDATSPVEVVTALGRGSDLNQKIAYTFAANVSAGPANTDTRVVTLTLTN